MPREEEFPVVYANLAKITHSPFEFLVDFKRLGPESREMEGAPTLVRIVLHPIIAKGLRDALAHNVRTYEEQYGEIPAPPKGGDGSAH